MFVYEIANSHPTRAISVRCGHSNKIQLPAEESCHDTTIAVRVLRLQMLLLGLNVPTKDDTRSVLVDYVARGNEITVCVTSEADMPLAIW